MFVSKSNISQKCSTAINGVEPLNLSTGTHVHSPDQDDELLKLFAEHREKQRQVRTTCTWYGPLTVVPYYCLNKIVRMIRKENKTMSCKMLQVSLYKSRFRSNMIMFVCCFRHCFLTALILSWWLLVNMLWFDGILVREFWYEKTAMIALLFGGLQPWWHVFLALGWGQDSWSRAKSRDSGKGQGHDDVGKTKRPKFVKFSEDIFCCFF